MRKRYVVKFVYLGDEPLEVTRTVTRLGAEVSALLWPYRNQGVVVVEKL